MRDGTGGRGILIAAAVLFFLDGLDVFWETVMYQGATTKTVRVLAAATQIVTFGPFDLGDFLSGMFISVVDVSLTTAGFLGVEAIFSSGSGVPDAGSFATGQRLMEDQSGSFYVIPATTSNQIYVPFSFPVKTRGFLAIRLIPTVVAAEGSLSVELQRPGISLSRPSTLTGGGGAH